MAHGRGTLNRILTAVAVIMVAVWAYKFFIMPDSGTVRSAHEHVSGGTSSLLWLSIVVVCAGYLLWKILGWLFWHKYFDEDPPDNNNDVR